MRPRGWILLPSTFLVLIAMLLSQVNHVLASLDFSFTASDENHCINFVESPDVIVETAALREAIKNRWWLCSEHIIRRLAKEGSKDLDHEFHTEQREITKQLNSLRAVLENSKPVQELSPAFEWAQSGSEIFISIKFAHKLDAPATLGVTVDEVEMSHERIIFKASSTGRKRFILDLDLFGAIDTTASTWTLGSVGRCTLQLKKLQDSPSRWPALIKDGKKRPNMHTWWAKHEQYTAELEAIEDGDFVEATAPKEKSTTKKEKPEKKENMEIEHKDNLTPDEIASATRQARIDDARSQISVEKKEALLILEKEFKAKRKIIDEEQAQKKALLMKDFDQKLKEKVAAVRYRPVTEEL